MSIEIKKPNQEDFKDGTWAVFPEKYVRNLEIYCEYLEELHELKDQKIRAFEEYVESMKKLI